MFNINEDRNKKSRDWASRKGYLSESVNPELTWKVKTNSEFTVSNTYKKTEVKLSTCPICKQESYYLGCLNSKCKKIRVPIWLKSVDKWLFNISI